MYCRRKRPLLETHSSYFARVFTHFSCFLVHIMLGVLSCHFCFGAFFLLSLVYCSLQWRDVKEQSMCQETKDKRRNSLTFPQLQV